jgi:hypothetical protein
MPWESDPTRFVVPAGMTEAEALVVRRQLQIMARLDSLEMKIEWIIQILQTDISVKQLTVGEKRD